MRTQHLTPGSAAVKLASKSMFPCVCSTPFTTGWYSVRDEAFYSESELVDGKAPTGADVAWVEKEASYFFRLSEWEQPLLDFYEANPDFIYPPSRRNEVGCRAACSHFQQHVVTMGSSACPLHCVYVHAGVPTFATQFKKMSESVPLPSLQSLAA